MDYVLNFIYIAIAVITYLFLRKAMIARGWSKIKVRFLYGLTNTVFLFVVLYFLNYFFDYLELNIILVISLIFGLFMFGISFLTFRNERQEKKNMFDKDFSPNRDIWILSQDKDFWNMQIIAVILVVLPLLAVFVAVYFLIE
ncbi:magnesium-transporting ATPase (P-type) [Bacillus mesophilus]|uniref:Uncharacterized protein n=1 Tax=Bacillus mesophilus TaxID=1808955 RepID=A0A6M0QBS9_9BACI|nr:hypothetical protein [Bacillus mesophilus]MBM7662161.1 magnesium-transporting ATPase (P-type) [Bacillus mesophilus]NEY72488.1 hypothetical protein [Bacillus mesophilus]